MSSPHTAVPGAAPQQAGFHYKYTVQKGYFAQSEDSTNDQDFDFVIPPLFVQRQTVTRRRRLTRVPR